MQKMHLFDGWHMGASHFRGRLHRLFSSSILCCLIARLFWACMTLSVCGCMIFPASTHRAATPESGRLTCAEKALITGGATHEPMRVLLAGNKDDERILKTPSMPVVDLYDRDIPALTARMLITAQNARSNGIAAPQIGLNWRVMIIQRLDLCDESGKHPYEVCFNPVILKHSEKTTTHIEGCMSLPGYSGPVERPTTIDVQYMNHQGRSVTHSFTGKTAMVFCHELDHLDGILYTDRMKDKSLLKQCLPWEYYKK